MHYYIQTSSSCVGKHWRNGDADTSIQVDLKGKMEAIRKFTQVEMRLLQAKGLLVENEGSDDFFSRCIPHPQRVQHHFRLSGAVQEAYDVTEEIVRGFKGNNVSKAIDLFGTEKARSMCFLVVNFEVKGSAAKLERVKNLVSNLDQCLTLPSRIY